MKLVFGIIALCALVGCKTALQTGGAYAPGTAIAGTTNYVATSQPDAAFYLVDSAFDLSYSTINAVFQFERDNRAYLWKLSPEIKHTLDKIRPTALDVVVRYARARKAYLKNPIPLGLSQLQGILAELQKIAPAVQAVLPK